MVTGFLFERSFEECDIILRRYFDRDNKTLEIQFPEITVKYPGILGVSIYSGMKDHQWLPKVPSIWIILTKDRGIERNNHLSSIIYEKGLKIVLLSSIRNQKKKHLADMVEAILNDICLKLVIIDGHWIYRVGIEGISSATTKVSVSKSLQQL